jgi:glyoxylase-like metal-dependent hydrolase (beta-lactamase superfamily II)
VAGATKCGSLCAMSKRRRRWPWVLLSLVVVLGLAKYTLLDRAAEARGEYVIDLPALHHAATAAGQLPSLIEVEKVGTFAFPRTLVVAGDGFKMHKMVLLAHRIMWPDRSVIIDTAMPPSATAKMPGSAADPAAYERLEKAMKVASAIVCTHEHPDHVGGIASAVDPAAIAKQTRLTREQLQSPKLERGEFRRDALAELAPLDYQGVYAVAPGVVVQKAPGHSPGSQLVYVELADGKRFLFVGDIAWSKDNIRLQRGRPGIATLLMKEDRPAVAAQLKALGQLPPDVHVVVAHDPVALEQDLAAGLYRQGFSGM